MEIESLSLLVYVWIGNGWKGGRRKSPKQRESELLNYIVYRVHLLSHQRRRSMWRSVRRKVEIETPRPLRTLYPWRLLKRRNSWFIFTSSKQKKTEPKPPGTAGPVHYVLRIQCIKCNEMSATIHGTFQLQPSVCWRCGTTAFFNHTAFEWVFRTYFHIPFWVVEQLASFIYPVKVYIQLLHPRASSSVVQQSLTQRHKRPPFTCVRLCSESFLFDKSNDIAAHCYHQQQQNGSPFL